MHKKNVTQKSKKIKLPQLVWMGFNYVLGIGFLVAVLQIFNFSGVHSLWILLLTGIVVGGAALAFMRNAQMYSETNGGASEYNRRSFGSFMGWLVGFFQWTLGPIGASVNILILLEFSLSGIVPLDLWGDNSQLYLRLISIIIFVFISSLAILGLKQFKIFFNIVSSIKWILLLIIIISAIIIVTKTQGQHYLQASSFGKLSTVNFNASFLLFFYAFAGFENFVVIAQNVQEPKRTMPKAIVFSLLGAGIFYIIALILIMGTMNKNWELNSNNVINLLLIDAFGVGALFIGVIAQIFSRATTDLQNPLYAGAFLQGMADQKYLPTFFKKVNQKNNLPQRAMIVNLFIIVLFAFVWLIIPYIAPIELQTIKSLISIYSIVTLFIYSTVIISALKLVFTHQIKTKVIELILWIISLSFLLFQIAVYFIQLQKNLGGIVTILILCIFSTIWYFAYIKPKLNAVSIEKNT